MITGPIGLKHRRRFYSLDEFRAWANPLLGESPSYNDSIGTVQSIHLYRETKAPLHHEFAIISLGKTPENTTSWLRVERAARFKTRWHKLESDSLGPLLGGVKLRESISFASTKQALLYEEADELAFVARSAEACSTDPLRLKGLIQIFNSVSTASPVYQLLTYNCRWFARQMCLSVALRFDTIVKGQSTVIWRDNVISYDDFAKNIVKDPFGGRPLQDKQSTWVLAMSRMQAAERLMDECHYAEALSALQEFLPEIGAYSEDAKPIAGPRILAGSLLHQAWCLLRLGRAPEGLKTLDESLSIFESSVHPPSVPVACNSLNQLSWFSGLLDNLQYRTQAMRLQRAALIGWPNSPSQWSEIAIPLGVDCTRLMVAYTTAQGNMARFCLRAGNTKEALYWALCAVQGTVALYNKAKTKHCFTLAWDLNLFSIALQENQRVGEAYLVSALSLHFMREHRELHGPSTYAYVLWFHSRVLRALSDEMYAKEGVECAAEALELTRSLCAENPQLYQFNLGVLLAQRLNWMYSVMPRILLGTDPQALTWGAINLINELIVIVPEGLKIWKGIAAKHPPAVTFVIEFLTIGRELGISPSYASELNEVQISARASGAINQPLTLSMYYGHEGGCRLPGGNNLRIELQAERFRGDGLQL